eukprot:scaffold1883_cov396-Prasinococcus_capsulatus_cf.AAC.11
MKASTVTSACSGCPCCSAGLSPALYSSGIFSTSARVVAAPPGGGQPAAGDERDAPSAHLRARASPRACGTPRAAPRGFAVTTLARSRRRPAPRVVAPCEPMLWCPYKGSEIVWKPSHTLRPSMGLWANSRARAAPIAGPRRRACWQ